MNNHTMVVITGPTGVGKTGVGIHLSQLYNSPIISADSRQIYKEIPIGTAAPTVKEQKQAVHFLVGTKSVTDYYSAFEFEQEALELAQKCFKNNSTVFMIGGSMMYIDSFCNGIDELPTIDPELRKDLMIQYENKGLQYIQRQLKILDPVFYDLVDLKNPKRIIHALEICLMTGKPYSQLRTHPKAKRPFKIIKIGLNMDRQELYQRINQRVELMFDQGLLEEARSLIPFRHHNALNTVGFKELFAYFDGEHDLERAKELIQRNSRHYAKKQLSWFNRDKNIRWFHPKETREMAQFIEEKIANQTK